MSSGEKLIFCRIDSRILLTVCVIRARGYQAEENCNSASGEVNNNDLESRAKQKLKEIEKFDKV